MAYIALSLPPCVESPEVPLMPSFPKRLKILDQELLALDDDAMLLSELDGFLAGLAVCPERIEPQEWLPVVWGQDGEGGGTTFESDEHVEEVLGAVMAHHRAVEDLLRRRPHTYEPVFDVDDESGEIVWATWAEGFRRALQLRPQVWESVLADEETDACTALNLMGALIAIAMREAEEAELSKEQVDALTELAPTTIPGIVATLYAWRAEQAPDPALATAAMPKVGRNDPCPCGSGKKYKKCCGLG